MQDSGAGNLVARYEEFFAASKPALMGLAYLLTGNVQESQDLVQETLLRAWRDWPSICSYEDPKAWDASCDAQPCHRKRASSTCSPCSAIT